MVPEPWIRAGIRANQNFFLIPPRSKASPDDPVADVSNVANESQALSDELQVGPRYNLRDRSTIGPADKYGFPSVNAVVDEPSTYQEASSIPEWQLAMCEELAALDRQGT